MKKQYVLVNGDVATSATWIKGGEQIQLSIPEEATTNKRLIFPLKVLFEDEHLAVVHKPAGILVSGNSFKTIANALSQNVQPSQLPDACAPQPVHRLDYATTGILLIGKTSTSIRVLNKLFENKVVEKSYYAVTIGAMPAAGDIHANVDDKASTSSYSVIQSAVSDRFKLLNLVKLNPKTGRRHQLRKHLAGIGNPILGDKDYSIDGLILNGKGLYLHAYSLKFIHPFTDEQMHLKDALPERFSKIFPEIVSKTLKT